MKKTKVGDRPLEPSDELRSEYAFDYTQARPNRFASPSDRDRLVVALDPDVSKVFTTAESVNSLLRALIETMPKSSGRP